jgi:asparagine synthase (glutamine-hydrolysing)
MDLPVDAAFFEVERRGDTIVTGGQPSFQGGHRISGPASTVDDGVFADWRWDGEQLRVRTDRYACFPLFYWHSDRSLAVSTSIARLLEAGAPADLDTPALAAFLRLGFFLGEDTPFAAIRAVPPACTATWRDGRLDLSSGYAFQRAIEVSRDEAIDGFNHRFRAALVRRAHAPSPVQLPLSGGRDSRHILLELCAIGSPPDGCVTVVPFPPRETLEVAIAAAVANAANVRHVVVPQTERRVRAERRKNELTHFLSDEHTHFLALAEYLRAHAATAYDGLAGDMVTGQTSSLTPALLDLVRGGRLHEAALCMFHGYEKRGIEGALRGLLAARFYERVGPDVATTRVVAELRRHLDAANPVLSFFFWSRTRRELALAPYAMMRATCVFAPYLDHAVFDFLMALPPEIVLDHQLHSDAIARAHPRFAQIPFEERPSSTAGHAAHRQTAIDLATMLLVSRSPVRRSYALPRLGASAVTGLPQWLWFVPLVTYLTQLAERTRRAHSGATGPESCCHK